jgi:hypothetical protein
LAESQNRGDKMSDEMNTVVEESQESEVRTYSQEDVDALLQSEGDKRVTQAMQKKEKQIEALKKQIENEKSLSQLDEESRATAEKDLKIAELEEQVNEFKTANAKAEVMKVLNARGLSAEFAEMLNIGADAEAAVAQIDAFDKLFKKEVERVVKTRLAQSSNIPQVADASNGKMTKEEFNKLPIHIQQQMYNADPELVNQFIGG